MFVTKAELATALLAEDPSMFVSNHIFEPVPHAFGENRSAWISYKMKLAGLIDVDASEIVLTGSAAIGFSLNPEKNFLPFHGKSDFDIGVINSHYFDLAWRYLRQNRVNWLTLPQTMRQAIKMHQKNYVFSGTIATNWILALLPFGKTWQEALDHMGTVAPSNGREVKLRIYKDFDSLRFYQASNVGTLRSGLLEFSAIEVEIPTDAFGAEDEEVLP